VVFDTSSSELVRLYGVGQSIVGTAGWFVAVQCWYILLGSFVAVPRYVVLPWVHSSPELVWRCGLGSPRWFCYTYVVGCSAFGAAVWFGILSPHIIINLAPRCC
jgi:hypothetical protein